MSSQEIPGQNSIIMKPIGVIRSPYKEGGFVPRQPVEREEGESRIELEPGLAGALDSLAGFRYIYVLFYFDRNPESGFSEKVSPPWAGGRTVGMLASRTPNRPNRIGLSIVRLKRIEGNVIVTSLLDCYDNTPVLDIKPYIKDLDSKQDANLGWIEKVPDHDHKFSHVRGIPHHHGHEHDHSHAHEHSRSHHRSKDSGHSHD